MKQTETPIYTSHHIYAIDDKNFTKRVGSICVNTQLDSTFILLDTTIDFASLPRPADKDTVRLKVAKRNEPIE